MEEVEVVVFIHGKSDGHPGLLLMVSFKSGREGRRTAQTWDPPPLVLVVAGRDIEVMEGLPGSLWSNDMIKE